MKNLWQDYSQIPGSILDYWAWSFRDIKFLNIPLVVNNTGWVEALLLWRGSWEQSSTVLSPQASAGTLCTCSVHPGASQQQTMRAQKPWEVLVTLLFHLPTLRAHVMFSSPGSIVHTDAEVAEPLLCLSCASPFPKAWPVWLGLTENLAPKCRL